MARYFRRAGFDVVILLVYTVITLIATWPMAPRLNTDFAGQDPDVWINPWATWWTEKAFTEGRDLYYTDLMFYPHGVSLAFHSFSHLNTLLALLLQSWLGSLGAHNATILLAHALSGYATFCLTRYLTRSLTGAFFAGLVFAFFPYRMEESAHPVIVSTQWIPLYLLFFVRFLKEGRIRLVVPAVLFFVFTACSSWHLMLFSCLLSGAYLVYALAVEHLHWSRQIVIGLFGFILVTLLILAPILYPIVQEQITASQSYVGVDLELGRGNDLIGFFLPPRNHIIWGDLVSPVYDQINRRTAYIGFIVIGLVVIGGWLNWSRARFWILVACVTLLVSLGPYLQIGGQATGIVVPWSAPFVWLFRHPFRFNVVLGLAVAVSSGIGLSALLHRLHARGPRWQWSVAGGAVVLLAFEYMAFPFPTVPAVVPDFYFNLARSSGSGAVLELPMGRQSSKPYLYYQMIHGRPLVEGVVSRTPLDAYEFIEEVPILRSLRACGEKTLPFADISPALGDLGEWGIDYVIVHKGVLQNDLATWLSVRGPAPSYEDSQVAAYNTRADYRPTTDGAHLLEACTAVQSMVDGSVSARPGEIVDVPLAWMTAVSPKEEYVLDLALVDQAGEVKQSSRYEVMPDIVAASQLEGQAYVATYRFQVSMHTAPGAYRLQVKVVPSGEVSKPVLSASITDVCVYASAAVNCRHK